MMIHIFWRGLVNIFLIFLSYAVKRCTVLHDVQNVPSNYFMIFLNLIMFYPMCWYRSITPYATCYAYSHANVSRSIFSSCVYIMYMIGSRNCVCLVAWVCYQLMARPGGGTAAPPWPDPCAYEYMHFFCFWYNYFILNIIHIIDEKRIIYMCLPIVYMILPVFYCFYYLFLLFVCIHALSEMTK